MIHHIDLSVMLRQAVCDLYSNLVTRPTGAAVRHEIERFIGERRESSLTVIDFQHVGLLDFSCADEVVAKLLLGQVTRGATGEAYFLVRGVRDVHLDAIEAVLERYGLALVVDLDEQYQGGVMGRLGERKALLQNMEPDGKGRVRLDYIIPARGLIGFQTEFKTLTAGTGLLFHVFDHYGPKADGDIGQRNNGVLISNGTGPSPAYAQMAMQERGRLFIEPGEEIYEGQILGINSKDNDLTVNALRGKQLTNFRASGKDDDEGLIPPIRFSLEQALEFIDDDELVEVTPKQIRLRKKLRTEVDRKRASRAA